MGTYICSKCKIEKDLSEFRKKTDRASGHGSHCKECVKKHRDSKHDILFQQNKERLLKNKDVIKEKRHIYYLQNKDRIDLVNKLYREAYPEKVKAVFSAYYNKNRKKVLDDNVKRRKIRLEGDPLFKLACSIRSSIKQSIQKKGHVKNSPTSQILGISFAEFKLYLEGRFETWMNWENYGKYNGGLNYGWDIDHVIPISSAKTEEEVLRLNHYTNLQPLCSKMNRDIKSNKIEA